jgi:hypothetical protein
MNSTSRYTQEEERKRWRLEQASIINFRGVHPRDGSQISKTELHRRSKLYRRNSKKGISIMMN